MKKRLFSLFLILCLLLSGCTVVIETAPPVSTESAATTGGGELMIHFLDVGQADCALLEYEGQYVLIDGGNRDDSDLVVTYLEEQGVSELEAVICSHAHEDHVGGLPAVLAVYPTKAVYAPTNTYSSKVFDNFLYYTDQQGLSVTIPAPGDVIALGDVALTVMGPVKTYADPNDTSIVLKVTYGEIDFLFTGDMETGAENDMLDWWGEKAHWQCEVLKVGHHGSNTSTSYRLLNEVQPQTGVIPVGKDNDYGHPHAEPMSRLAQAGVMVLRTDELGHIYATTDGETLNFHWQNQSAAPVAQEEIVQTFIGNKNSKTFHTSTCASLPAEKNRVHFDTYEEAVNSGYKPCNGCLG